MSENILYLVLLIVLFTRQSVWCEDDLISENVTPTNETTFRTYMRGVDLGIINMEKYPLEAFQRDEQNIFRDLYAQYVTMNGKPPLGYEEWLIVNNFGILPDTQESLYQRKTVIERIRKDNKRDFVNTVRKGDILITGRGIGGLVGHAAIMSSDDWVLEMRGGEGWHEGIKSNNRKVEKNKWYDEHSSDWTTVYRCKDATVAKEAATWAYRTFYNPNDGSAKTKHITYKLNTDIWSTDPNYCSKLVIQAYYFGTGNKKVIKDLSLIGRVIVPTTVPSYFLSPYTLINKGKY